MAETPDEETPRTLWRKLRNALRRRTTPDEAADDEAFGAEWVAERHGAVREWWSQGGEAPAGLVGLALSGGGIRSATFSLGLLQALAKREVLGKIDILSTVSGGSYIGCFLRSLFLPEKCRGIDRPPASETTINVEKEVPAQADFALRVLRSPAGRKLIEGPDKRESVCNPLWWLREHSRYLAPNGPTDYGYAAAYLSRNWLAMMYVIAIALAIPLILTLSAEGLIRQVLGMDLYSWIGQAFGHPPTAAPNPLADCLIQMHGTGTLRASIDCQAAGSATKAVAPAVPAPGARLSPLLVLSLLPVSVSASLGMAYWLSAGMSANERKVRNQRGSFFKMMAWVVLIALGFTALLLLCWPWGALLPFHWTIAPAGWKAAALGLGFVYLEILFGLLYFSRVEVGLKRLSGETGTDQNELLTAELRRRLTESQASVNWIALWMLAIGAIESGAAWLRHQFWQGVSWHEAASGIVLPALAFLFKKLPDWFGGGKPGGTWSALIARFLPAIAAVVGVALYATLAILVDAVLHAGLWRQESWQSDPDWRTFAVIAVIVGTLIVLTGRTTGFLNLSSWHNLYASRLTRAYLGATNIARLRSIAGPKRDVTIRDNHVLDYIQPDIYGRLVLPAPLHIINVTVNRTVDPSSQIVARDRKGEPIWIEPGGIEVGGTTPAFLPWSSIGRRGKTRSRAAENLSLGQWCSISGAAASTGMGRQTSLGYALAMSFANVRLGYWWWAPALADRREDRVLRGRRPQLAHLLLSVLPTFTFLYNELTARYSRAFTRQYLSDGGHFENSGAYALIRRGVPLILVSDNGQDPDYAFADLESLVRLVRLDLNGETALLGGHALRAFRDRAGCTDGAIFIDPAAEPDWKHKLKSGETKGVALVLRVDFSGERDPVHLVWVKPRLMEALPEDVAGYAGAHPDFPQQTTGDQFFDEAQWESYRRLGEEEMTRLLAACPDLFPPQVAPKAPRRRSAA